MGLPIGGALYCKQDMSEMWLRNLMDTYCDSQPDGADMHLPFGTKNDVYSLYCR